jgi:hypothetical protein
MVIGSVETSTGGTRAARARDQARTARLIFDAELVAGRLGAAALEQQAVVRATRVSPVPPRPVRIAEQVRGKLRGFDVETAVTAPLVAVRRALRVDEFPHYEAWDRPERFGTETFERFHAIMAEAGVPYMIAVLPRLCREPLDPSATGSRPLEDGEIATLQRISGEGVSFALHGRDHRTRHSSPRRHSELCGLSAAQTDELLAGALGELAEHGVRPAIFVPPYNRFDARQYAALAARFDVVCGGPESIGTMGFHSTPQWRGEAVYLPAYAPLYEHARNVLPAVERAIEQASGLWTPAVLHWGWESDDGWGELKRLARRLAGFAVDWGDFHASVLRSRGGA